MIKLISLVSLVCFYISVQAQQYFSATDVNPDPEEEYDNIWSKEIFSDSLSTTTVYLIKKTVKEHKHEHHTEVVYVISGSGDVQLGDEKLSIVSGDIIQIPRGTRHSLTVTSREPVKLISIHSPKFDGSDRVYLE